jgi:ribosome biogenesis GTPase A
MQDAETLNRIAEWRSKALAGTITVDEMKAAVIILRESRRAAFTEATTRKSLSRKAPARDVDSMLDDL